MRLRLCRSREVFLHRAERTHRAVDTTRQHSLRALAQCASSRIAHCCWLTTTDCMTSPCAIWSATVMPDATLPNRLYDFGRVVSLAVQMKNCDPLVLRPLFAIARQPDTYCCFTGSSLNW